MTTTTHAKTDLVRQAFTALNGRDREGFVALHAPETVLHDGADEIRGIDAIADHEFTFMEAFSDLTLTPEAIVVEGETAMARWRATGTHDGEFDGIEPTHEAFEMSVMGEFRFEDGRVAEVWLVADRMGLMEQLGVVDPPGE